MRVLKFILCGIWVVGLYNVAFGYNDDRVALVIGNSTYKYSPLINPVNDARAMQKALESVGFKVIEKENLNLQEMKEAISSFGKQLSGASVGLFYYAGHGVQINGRNYLIPVTASIADEKEVGSKAVDANLVISQMGGESASRTNIIILDACRVTSLFRSMRERKGLAHMDAPVGTLIAYSTGPGKEAIDGINSNSFYTEELIKHIPTPGLRLEDVFNRVRKAVRKKSNGQQVPWESTSLEGAFYFLPSGERPIPALASYQPDVSDVQPQPIAVPQPPQTDKELWIEPATGIEFVWVPRGCYPMGCGAYDGKCEEDESPVHEVCVDGFWIGRYEVTNEQFLVFINDLDGRGPVGEAWFKTSEEDSESPISGTAGNFQVNERYRKYPIIGVSWYGAKAFTTWLSDKTGKKFDLPTEAQWEYAARSGGKPETFSGGNDIQRVGWISPSSLHPVGTKSPNALGIYDMSGNVWEWCRDFYAKEAYKTHTMNNPLENYASDSSSSHVIRGGSYRYDADRSRTANRGSHRIAGQSNDLGFRVMLYPFSRAPINIHKIRMVSQNF